MKLKTPTNRTAAGAPAPKPSGPIIGKNERCYLGRLGAEAWAHQKDLGLTDLGADDWRHGEQFEVTGHASLTTLPRAMFRNLQAHYFHLLGRDERALAQLLRTGQVHDHGPKGDTYEAREESLAILRQMIRDHGRVVRDPKTEAERACSTHATARGGAIGEAYVATICQRRFHRREPRDLEAADLRLLLYTIKNRIAAREGRGTPAGRNKSQRGE